MRRGALVLLTAFLLAGCGSAVETEWAGPPRAHADGSIPVGSFNDYLGDYEDYAESPEGLAAEFLRLDEHRGATTSLVTRDGAEGGDRVTAVATLDGVLDDSVDAVRYVLVVTREEGEEGWRLESAVRTQRCQAGRGHASFSAEPCL
jgi:hypothetical protein